MGACRVRICTPGATRCAGAGSVETCAVDGLSWSSSACAVGTGCYAGVCRAPRLLILNYRTDTNPKRWCTSADGAAASWTCGTFGPAGDGSLYASQRPTVAGGTYWIGTTDNRLWRSSDGSTWITAATLAHPVVAVSYGAGMFIAISGTTAASTSRDGTTWSPVTLPMAALGIERSATRWVLSGGAGERRLLTTTDGASFTFVDPGVTAPTTGALARCADGTLFLAHPANGSRELFRSVDGAAWTRVTITSGAFASAFNHSFNCHGSTLIAWGDDGGYRFFQRRSTDGGATWTRVTVYDGHRSDWPIPMASAWDPVSNTMIVLGSYYGDARDPRATNAYYRTTGPTGLLAIERIASAPFDIIPSGQFMTHPASVNAE
jgi:hypothetical protein